MKYEAFLLEMNGFKTQATEVIKKHVHDLIINILIVHWAPPFIEPRSQNI